MQKNKIILVGISCIVVVGVVIGCIAGVSKHNSSKKSSGVGDGGGETVSTTSKSVSAICAPTDYKEACTQSLSTVANNQSATPMDFIQAAIQFTIDEVKKVLANSSSVKNAAKDSQNKMAADDCEELLQYATDELQASFSMVGDPSMHNDTDRRAELNNFLSAVRSYLGMCIDGFNSTELQDMMSKNLANTTQLSENALAMVSALDNLLQQFNIPLSLNSNSNPTKRSLLTDEEGYPTWMDPKDRKLIAEGKGTPKPNAVVAKDGSGQFKTIGAALKAYPKKLPAGSRYVIHVKAGVYNEYITIEKKVLNVYMYGDGPTKTILTGSKSVAKGKYSTYQTSSLSAIGNGFIVRDMGFKNTAGPEGHQAVALRVMSDKSAVINCRIEGYQDTLYTPNFRSFFRDCFISGTVDFIFGKGSTLIQNSEIHVRKPLKNQQNTVTAHGRESRFENTGIVIQNCRFTKEPQPNPTYLGRPWKAYARTVIMESDLGNTINPEGWMKWDGATFENTCYYAEYGNRGTAGARRVTWKGFHMLKNKNDVLQFTAGTFLGGNQWIPATGAPYYLGMAH